LLLQDAGTPSANLPTPQPDQPDESGTQQNGRAGEGDGGRADDEILVFSVGQQLKFGFEVKKSKLLMDEIFASISVRAKNKRTYR